jgi:hypothetical protein
MMKPVQKPARPTWIMLGTVWDAVAFGGSRSVVTVDEPVKLTECGNPSR